MESIIALEELIKENESKITLQKRQLADHESGENKLSRMSLASTENALEESEALLTKYKAMLEKLLAQDKEELEEKEKLVQLATRKKYFDEQPSRITHNKAQGSDKILEALRIIGELPSEVQFEDDELFELATKSIELSLPELKELSEKLTSIRSEFQMQMKKAGKTDLQEFETLNFLIPIIILHFHILLSNIKQHIEDINTKALEEQKSIIKKNHDRHEKWLNEIMNKEQLIKKMAQKAQHLEEELKEQEENKQKEESQETEDEKDTNNNNEEQEPLKNNEKDSENSEEITTQEAYIEDKNEIDIKANLEQLKQEIEELSQELESLKNKKIEEIPVPQVKELKFSGFPKYQDWWIRELWVSHQAYFALYKWKSIVNNLCKTKEQKKTWSIIFDRWVFIKKLLNDKGELAFHYHYAFDSLLQIHAEIEEELDKKNILSMETIIKKITLSEDLTKEASFHNVDTPYLNFKRRKQIYKKDESK